VASTVTRPPISVHGTVDPASAAPERTVAQLRARLFDPRRSLFERFRAIFALRNLATDEAALALGDAMLADKSALLRHECAYVLGQMQRPASIPQLVQALHGDVNPMVRHEAAESLGAIGGDAVIEVLTSAGRKDPAIEVRESCELALDNLRHLRNDE
jgi:deoxyhypusine monooxygenase